MDGLVLEEGLQEEGTCGLEILNEDSAPLPQSGLRVKSRVEAGKAAHEQAGEHLGVAFGEGRDQAAVARADEHVVGGLKVRFDLEYADHVLPVIARRREVELDQGIIPGRVNPVDGSLQLFPIQLPADEAGKSDAGDRLVGGPRGVDVEPLEDRRFA
ncbi:MAG: hypothetical protein NT061_06490 [Spirochaetes bacterium]|nr:hypothetical protein [Spirochaetota bacterium]